MGNLSAPLTTCAGDDVVTIPPEPLAITHRACSHTSRVAPLMKDRVSHQDGSSTAQVNVLNVLARARQLND
jgi:hypothetical protein